MLQDLRYALRTLRRSPGFTLATVATFALGIGANSALFSVVDAVLLRPLPYPEPERLVRVYETPPRQPDEMRSAALPTVADWRAETHGFAGIAAYGPWTFDLAGTGRPEQLEGATASGDLFRILGVRPLLGRVFSPAEELPGGPRAVLLGYDLWQRRFGGDPTVVGRTLRLSGDAYTVIGVLPQGFRYPARAELWASLAIDHEFAARGARHLSVLARLRPGATLAAANADLAAVERRLARRFPENYADYGVRLVPLHERIVGGVRPALLVLLGAVGLVLLIACVNVASLVLARAVGRQRELAVRLALGASRARLARQLLAESLVLALAGGAVGTLVALWSVDLLHALAPSSLPRLAEIGVDGRVLLFTLALTVGTGLGVGLLPTLHVVRPDLQLSLKEGGRGTAGSARHHRLRGALVVAETALALVLLAGAGLLVRSFERLSAVDPGLAPDHLLVFHVGLPPARQDSAAYAVAFYRELRERLAALPGVRGVGMASRLPLSGEDHSNGFHFVGETVEPGHERSAQDRAVTPGYFATLGIPVRRGREFTEADAAGAAPVAIVNEAFARRWFPGRNPVGRSFVPHRAGSVPREIVGVVGDTRQFSIDLPAQPEFYLPHAQDPWDWLLVVVRTAGAPLASVSAVERTVWSLDPEMPVTGISTMDGMLAATTAPRRFDTTLLGALAVVALLLACVGIYGVMAYSVAERTHEVGVRLALGARPADVLRLVVGRALRLAGLGVAIGLAGALLATRALRGLLYDVSATDPFTFVVVTLVLGAVALLASWIPARRAARVDPMVALREE